MVAILKKKFYSFLLIFLLALLGFLFYKRYSDDSLSRRNQAFLKAETEKLERRNNELEKKIEEAMTGVFIEKVAREKLQLRFPGETVLFLEKEENQEGESEPNLSFWQKWWHHIFKRD